MVVATEAAREGMEGINLQFCNLIINYHIPRKTTAEYLVWH